MFGRSCRTKGPDKRNNPRYIYRLDEFNNNPLINNLIVRDYCNLKNGNIISDFFNVLDMSIGMNQGIYDIRGKL